MVLSSSTQPRKQRKARYQAPHHLRTKLLGAPLSPQLREKHGGRRTVRVVTGDTVRIMRGDFAGDEGIVDMVDVKNAKLIVHGVAITKADGTEKPRKVDPSNVMVIKLNEKDPKRVARLAGGEA
ncbi:MAG TPA: 50S ribosomal protein L24 [Methanoregulaceae archaeon]|nr:50S ribosomal protein L24 [Methanoregulaceae archaeon]HOV68601.1 50S ribosomal protein L24 [Methanoregulaceae archaeon]HQJ88467.1 50S ribosomal protein L24 [Methanoregulaceae archaeon]